GGAARAAAREGDGERRVPELRLVGDADRGEHPPRHRAGVDVRGLDARAGGGELRVRPQRQRDGVVDGERARGGFGRAGQENDGGQNCGEGGGTEHGAIYLTSTVTSAERPARS